MNLTRTITGAAAAAAISLGLVVAGGTAAQAAPFCFSAISGKSGVVSCAANGQAYTFQARVLCSGGPDLEAPVTREVFGAMRNPGESSTATCAANESLVSVGAAFG